LYSGLCCSLYGAQEIHETLAGTTCSNASHQEMTCWQSSHRSVHPYYSQLVLRQNNNCCQVRNEHDDKLYVSCVLNQQNCEHRYAQVPVQSRNRTCSFVLDPCHNADKHQPHADTCTCQVASGVGKGVGSPAHTCLPLCPLHSNQQGATGSHSIDTFYGKPIQTAKTSHHWLCTQWIHTHVSLLQEFMLTTPPQDHGTTALASMQDVVPHAATLRLLT
jgi:hypothetical protein